MSHSTATPQRHDELDIEVAESTYREINGVRLHVLTAGEPADPLVVLLHGFPEFWYGWREYIDAFVDAGYRVIVPDQRGYNRSEKPDGIGQYRLPKLSGDVAGLIESEGKASAHVVGHDWGATVAWDLALRRPTVLDRLGIINVPHPTVFQQTLRSNPRQLAKSWYMFYFQLPRLPEGVAGLPAVRSSVSGSGQCERWQIPGLLLTKRCSSIELLGAALGPLGRCSTGTAHSSGTENSHRESVSQHRL